MSINENNHSSKEVISTIKNIMKNIIQFSINLFSSVLMVTACYAKETTAVETDTTNKSDTSEWIQLFNGKDLTGWTPKFKGHDLGVNFKNTFRVENGMLKVSYDEYKKWNNNFGHLFYKDEFSHYVLRAEYRFVGNQVAGGPAWALRNNGFMIHGQSAESMKKDQDFPNSIEVQLLGGAPDSKKPRPTLSICTPGTRIVMNGKLIKPHVIKSKGPTFYGDEWVAIEIEVRGSEVIRHKVNGKIVMEYNKPQLDNKTLLEKGTISIQAESHPTEFRKIELKVLKK